MYLHYKIYSATFLDSEYNIAEYSLNLPYNIACSVIAVFCYWRIYAHIRKSNAQISKNLNSSESNTRKSQQTRLALQFACSTGFCILGGMGFRIGPLILTFTPEMYMVVTVSEMIHCISTSAIFLLFNHDIRKKLTMSSAEKISYETRNGHDKVSASVLA
uniref:Uncharacterized protein n=1 Tax=Panagrolaimus davidi TaxID=227884 RepID=A0A914PLD9_9BILA